MIKVPVKDVERNYDNDDDTAKTGWMGVTILVVGDSITIGVQDTPESLYRKKTKFICSHCGATK